jgi:hypothetical protein
MMRERGVGISRYTREGRGERGRVRGQMIYDIFCEFLGKKKADESVKICTNTTKRQNDNSDVLKRERESNGK